MSMQLNDALTLLAMQLQLDPAELIRYASEDTIGGYHWNGAEQKWPMGSLFGVEGQTLYALVRALKPAHVVEIGSLRGCSTAHLATALSVNGSGQLSAVDIAENARDLFPKHLESVMSAFTADGLDWLVNQKDESIDLLFEDSSHGTEMCYQVAELCKTKLAPGGVLVMHDAGHDFAIVGDGSKIASAVGLEVRAGLERALGTAFRVYLAEPSDCGIAVYQRPKRAMTPSEFANDTMLTAMDHLFNSPSSQLLIEASEADNESGLESVYESDAMPYNTPTKTKRTRKAKPKA